MAASLGILYGKKLPLSQVAGIRDDLLNRAAVIQSSAPNFPT